MWEGVVWFRKRELLAFGAYAYEVVCGFIRMLFLDKRGHRKKTKHCANCSWMLLKALKWFVGVTRRCIGKTLFSFPLRYFGAKLRRPETVHSFVRITNFCVVEIGSAPKDSPAVTVIVTVIYIAQCAPYWRPTAHHKTIPVFRQTARIVWGHAFLSNKNNV